MNKTIIGALCLISMSSLGFCDGELDFGNVGTGPLKAPGVTKSEPVLQKAVKTAPAKKQTRPKKEENKTVTKTVLGQVGVVKSKVAYIHKNPSPSAGKYFEAPAGMRLGVVKESGNWCGVRMGEAAKGALGWVDKKNLTFTGELVTEVTEVRTPQRNNKAQVSRGYFNANRNEVASSAYFDLARRFAGTPYVYGGNSPATGMDCSAFVKLVSAERGVNLPRTAREQATVGLTVDPAADVLRPGDRLYFRYKHDYIDHAGIYCGNGYFVHCNAVKKGVSVDLLDTPKHRNAFVIAKRDVR